MEAVVVHLIPQYFNVIHINAYLDDDRLSEIVIRFQVPVTLPCPHLRGAARLWLGTVYENLLTTKRGPLMKGMVCLDYSTREGLSRSGKVSRFPCTKPTPHK